MSAEKKLMSLTRTSIPNNTIGLFQSDVEIGKGARTCSPYLLNFPVSKATIRVEPEDKLPLSDKTNALNLFQERLKARSTMVIIRLIDALVFGYEPPIKDEKSKATLTMTTAMS